MIGTRKVPPLSGVDAALVLRAVRLARVRGRPLLPAVSAVGGCEALPRIRTALPAFRDAGEEGFLDALERSLAAGADSPGAAALAAARRAGLPPEALDRLASWFSARARRRSAFYSSFAYPAGILLAALLVASIVFQAVVGSLAMPGLEDGFFSTWNELAGRPKLSWWKELLLWLVRLPLLVDRHPLLAPLYAAALVAAGALAVRAATRLPDRKLVLRLPLVGPYVRFRDLADYFATLGLLVRSGVPLPEAQQAATEAVGNPTIREGLADVSARVREGEAWAECIRSVAAVPPSAAWRVWNGYYRSDLPAELERVAAWCEGEAVAREGRMRTLSTVTAWILAGIGLAPVWMWFAALWYVCSSFGFGTVFNVLG